jgi:hypothetical protein
MLQHSACSAFLSYEEKLVVYCYSVSVSSRLGPHLEEVSFEYIAKKKKKLRGLSPLANYTDRATAACR